MQCLGFQGVPSACRAGFFRAFLRCRPSVLVRALVACSRDPAPHAPPPAPVTVVKAQAKDMPVLASAVGSVEPINSVALKSLIDGQILESPVKDGDDVKQNQLLFRIDPRPAEAALKQAEAAQAKDEATLAQARSQVKRYAAIADKGYISADQMEQYRTNARRGGREREGRSGQRRRGESDARLHRDPFADRRPHRPHPDPAGQSGEGERHQRAGRDQPDRADLRELRAARRAARSRARRAARLAAVGERDDHRRRQTRSTAKSRSSTTRSTRRPAR